MDRKSFYSSCVVLDDESVNAKVAKFVTKIFLDKEVSISFSFFVHIFV